MEDPIALAIQWRKKQSKITVVALAQEIGVDRKTLDFLTRGGKETTIGVLKKLAEYFKWGPVEVGAATLYDRAVRTRRGRKK